MSTVTTVTTAPITLDELDYLRLARDRDAVSLALLSGREAVVKAERDLAAAQERFKAAFAKASEKYGFDPAVSHRFNDERFQLIPEDQRGP